MNKQLSALGTKPKRDNMILVDFSGILFQSIFASISIAKPTETDNKYNVDEFINVAKGLVLNSLFEYQTKYSPTKGDIVICLDDYTEQNWRKSILPSYKSSRKTDRDESKIPFDLVFKHIDEFLEQLKTNTPWKVISVPGAEADDVILSLAKQYSQREPVLIISSDKDMIQAQKRPNVTQFSPRTKKFVTPETKGGDMEFWLTEHVLLGDSADEIPKITDQTKFSPEFESFLASKNIPLTEEKYFSLNEETRNKVLSAFGSDDIWKNPRLGPKMVQKLLEEGKVDEFINNNALYKKNFERNKQLILDDYIPVEICNKCVLSYVEQKKAISSQNTRDFKDYLSSNGLSQFTEILPFNFVTGTISIEDFL